MTWRQALSLCKWRISTLAALSTATGALSFSVTYALSVHVAVPLVGTLFLALGANALNQVQEDRLDGRMDRTRGRPVPALHVSRSQALVVAVCLLVGGTAVLAAGAGLAAAGLGALAVAWYNGVYTPLKRVTAFAAVPGALVGALPPVIGWVSAGGAALDPGALALALVFFLWQVPHFWFLLLRVGAEYETAGLPSLSRLFRPGQLARVAYAWLAAAAAAPLLLPLAGIASIALAPLYAAVGAALGLSTGVVLLRSGGGARFQRFAFRSVNAYLIILMAVLAVDRLGRAFP